MHMRKPLHRVTVALAIACSVLFALPWPVAAFDVSMDVQPRILQLGEAATLSLTISGRLAANEVLVIDTATMTAKVVDTDEVLVKNGLPYLSSLNLPELNLGTNMVSIEAEGCTFSSLTIQAKSRWR